MLVLLLSPCLIVSKYLFNYLFIFTEEGDIFSFVQKFEGIDFFGSLKLLADRAGVVLTRESNDNKKDDTLRYYEKMGLLRAESRTSSGYRLYSLENEKIVKFILGAKLLNFTLEEIKRLLTLDMSNQATCAEVLKHTSHKISEAEKKIQELKQVKKTLNTLVKQCPADNTSTNCCPILGHIKSNSIN